jgi:endonuclease YncB( thermonuclease family)
VARRGLPARRPDGPLTKALRRIFNPLFYLKVVIYLSLIGLFIVPSVADLINAAMKPVQAAEGSCRILRVVDGDTVTLMCGEEGMQSARLLGFDTPEKFSPRCTAEFVAAERAGWALRTMIQKADRLSLTREGVDQYGRALVRLELDGQDVADRMIREGHGRRYGGGPRGSWC